MNNRQSNAIHLMLLLSLILGGFILYQTNETRQLLLMALVLSFSLIQFFRYWLWDISYKKWTFYVLLGLQWLAAFGIQMVDGSFVPQIFFFILLAELAYKTPRSISVPFTLLCYGGFVAGTAVNQGFPPFEEISYVVPRFLEYALFFGFAFISKQAFEQQEKLAKAYERLYDSMQELEEKTLIQERIRISQEIHDTIGHTLTTSLISVQTVKQLLTKGYYDKAGNQLEHSRDHIRESIEKVRHASHTLYEQQSFIDLKQSLIALLEDTKTQTHITVKKSIEDLPPLSKMAELTLYRALQEGITNGLRHGKSTCFSYHLYVKDDILHAHLIDNGHLPQDFNLGFGLSSLRQRLRFLEGKLHISQAETGGCHLHVSFPARSRHTKEGEYRNEENKRFISR
ncbi:sensor histidine kinase [Salibacterium aidingense]|uniref:sensor histidine kinase n=1 Tax=Salibacterium aidingense TaxID=384933 RepID=UPI003BD6ACB9